MRMRFQASTSRAPSAPSAKARAACQEFLAHWKDADPDVPILKESTAEYENLKLKSEPDRRVVFSNGRVVFSNG